jgi:hypothetical protein
MKILLFSIGGLLSGVAIIWLIAKYIDWRDSVRSKRECDELIERLQEENKRFDEALLREDWDSVDRSLNRMRNL